MISWKTTKREQELIGEIVQRAYTACRIRDKTTLMMDLTATHANGTPLDLEGLLAADSFNFSHDILGIHRHINRETGKLEDCFRPRFAA